MSRRYWFDEQVERRSAIRLKLDERVCVVDQQTDEVLGIIADLHAHGFLLVGAAPLVIGDQYPVQFRLPRPVAGCEELSCLAECLWHCPTMAGCGQYWRGFQIMPGSTRSLINISQVLQAFASDYQQQPLGALANNNAG